MGILSLFKRGGANGRSSIVHLDLRRPDSSAKLREEDQQAWVDRDPTQHLCCRTVDYPARLHAAQLLTFLARQNWVDFAMASADMQDTHGGMCLEAGWWVRPWNPVAREVALLTTGGKKVYEWQTHRGERRRLRVFPIPSATVIRINCEPILGRCSLDVPKAQREYPWPGPPTVQHCPCTGHACPIWKASVDDARASVGVGARQRR